MTSEPELQRDERDDGDDDARDSGKDLKLGRATKAERFAMSMKRKRAAKLRAAETSNQKARIEKEKARARKIAQLKALASISDEVDEPAALEEAKEEEQGTLDKAAAKALKAALAAAEPKLAPGARLSPAQVAAAKAAADKARAALLAEQSIIRLNDKIVAAQVVVIGEDGGKLGLMSRAEALQLARKKGLDLLQMSPHIPHVPGGKPPPPAAAKLLVYKEYKLQQDLREKKEAKAKRLAHKEQKTVQMKAKIATGDINVKIGQMRRFLQSGHPVKLTFVARTPDPELFLPLFQLVLNDLLLDGFVEPGSLSESKPYINLNPMTERKRRELYPQLTDAQKQKHGVWHDERGVWRVRGRDAEEDARDNDAEMDEEDDEDEASAADNTSSSSTAASSALNGDSTAPASSAPKTAKEKKEEKRRKQKQTYVTAAPMFSRAAVKTK